MRFTWFSPLFSPLFLTIVFIMVLTLVFIQEFICFQGFNFHNSFAEASPRWATWLDHLGSTWVFLIYSGFATSADPGEFGPEARRTLEKHGLRGLLEAPGRAPGDSWESLPEVRATQGGRRPGRTPGRPGRTPGRKPGRIPRRTPGRTREVIKV